MDIRGLSPRGTAAFAAVAVLALAVLPGCSPEEPAQPPGSPAASPAAASGTVGLPAPVIVEPDQAEATASVGATIVFNQPDPANTTVSTDRPDIVELTQGSEDGSAQFNPGAVALAPGVAVVTIVAPDGTTSTVTVTVS
jgi:hypothetical protein